MNGPREDTAVSGDTHPWDGASSDSRIMRKLLLGAVPVCIDCGRDLESGEPRVTVRIEVSPNSATLVRCGDCEYRRLHG